MCYRSRVLWGRLFNSPCLLWAGARAVGRGGEHECGACGTLGINKQQLCLGICSSSWKIKESSTCQVAQYVEQTLPVEEEKTFPRSFSINWFRIWSRKEQVYFMKTKPELYKDWAENHPLKTGKMVFLFDILVFNCSCYVLVYFSFRISDNSWVNTNKVDNYIEWSKKSSLFSFWK